MRHVVHAIVVGALCVPSCTLSFERCRETASCDAGMQRDTGPEAGVDAGVDGGPRIDASMDGGIDPDGGVDAGSDGGSDGGVVWAGSVAAGWRHSCAARDGAVFCWGDNSSGQLGIGAVDSDPHPLPLPVTLPGHVVQVVSGREHTCGRLEDRRVYCWGSNGYLQTGVDVGSAPLPSPSAVGLYDDRGAVAISAGENTTCAVLDGGEIQCWGYNAAGELGRGGTSSPSPPGARVIGIVDAVDVAVGGQHACVIRSTGALACWGASGTGAQLGRGGSGDPSLAPRVVTGLSGVRAVGAGRDFTCAATATEVLCFGDNRDGQLGLEGPLSTDMPTLVSALDVPVVELSAYYTHICARTEAGRVLCWGSNLSESLGSGSRDPSSWMPSPVIRLDDGTELQDAVAVVLGEEHGCAALTEHRVMCWGADGRGQVGDDELASTAGVSGAARVRFP